MNMSDQPDNDLLVGVPDITIELKKMFEGGRLSERRVRYQLEHGVLPGGRLGSQWICSKKLLREELTKIAAGVK
jgi:hypothetical protein